MLEIQIPEICVNSVGVICTATPSLPDSAKHEITAKMPPSSRLQIPQNSLQLPRQWRINFKCGAVDQVFEAQTFSV